MVKKVFSRDLTVENLQADITESQSQNLAVISKIVLAETNRQSTCRSRADKSGYKMGTDLPLARRPPPQCDGCLCVYAETVAGIIAPPVQV